MAAEKNIRGFAPNMFTHVFIVFITLIALCCCCTVLSQADTFTDDQGITWDYTISEQNDQLTINSCDKIPSSGHIAIPSSINGKQVKAIADDAFNGKADIISVDIPDSITSIGRRAFRNCTGLKSITCPENLTSISNNAFENCSGLIELNFNDSLKAIRQYAFSGCSSLTAIRIPALITSIDNNTFINCTSLSSFTVDEGNKSYSAADGVLFNSSGTVLILYPSGKSVTVYEIPDGITKIDDCAFCGSLLEEIYFPSSVQLVGVSAFSNSKSLKTVHMNEGVQRLGVSAFSQCTSLRSITLPDTVKTVGNYCFEQCNNLTIAQLPDGLEFLGTGAFKCTSLDQNFKIPSGVKTIFPDTFSQCNNMKHFNIPATVETVSRNAFDSCVNLSDVYIESDTTSIESNAFYNCGQYDAELRKHIFTICAGAGSAASAYAANSDISFHSCTAEEYADIMANDTPVYDFDYGNGNSQGNNNGQGNNTTDNTETGTVSSDSGSKTSVTAGKAKTSTKSGTMSGTKPVPKKEKIKKTNKLKKPKFKAVNKKGKKVKLSWSKVKGADGYLIYVKGPKDKKFKRRVTRSAKVKSITHKGLIKGKKYKYKVAAYKVVKGKKVRGPFSRTRTVKIRK